MRIEWFLSRSLSITLESPAPLLPRFHAAERNDLAMRFLSDTRLMPSEQVTAICPDSIHFHAYFSCGARARAVCDNFFINFLDVGCYLATFYGIIILAAGVKHVFTSIRHERGIDINGNVAIKPDFLGSFYVT